MPIPDSIRPRFERYRTARLTWDPVKGGKKPIVSWNDHLVSDVGPEENFDGIAGRMLDGHYYPPDVIDAFGPWMDEDREVAPGDRMLQRARLIPFLAWPVVWSITEVFVAERTEDRCSLGYVTTEKHHGRGIWRADLRKREGRLELQVTGISGPQSWLFWLGLPIARALQKRAWRRAIEEFRTL